jgi:ADP-heptose:LPS heptosyltransferase
MKVLFICGSGFDYVQDLTFWGLKNALGKDLVVDYRWNKKYHLPLWKYPKNIGYTAGSLFRYPIRASDIKTFDLVIVGAVKTDAFETLISCIQLIPASVPMVFIDGGDSCDISGDLEKDGSFHLFEKTEQFRPFDLIFKREMLQDKSYPDRVLPFPMSFKGPLPLFNKYEKRFGVVFWGVESHDIRSIALERIKDKFDCSINGTVPKQSFNSYKRTGDLYLEALSQCKVVLNFRGAGFDTLRFWETLGVGSFLLSQRPKIRIPEPFVNHQHLVFLEDDIQDLVEKSHYYLKNDKQREAIAKAGNLHLLEHHRVSNRISFLLQSIAIFKNRHCFTSVPTVKGLPDTGKLADRKFDALPTPNTIRTIGVLMYGLLGDTLIRTPLLKQLRILYPRAEITVFVDPSGRDALSLTNLPDKMVVIDRRQKFMRVDIFYRVLHLIAIRRVTYDLLIDLYMGRSSRFVARNSGARFKIFAGFEETNCSWGLPTLPVSQFKLNNPYHCSGPALNALAFLTPHRTTLSTKPILDLQRLSALAMSHEVQKGAAPCHFFLISLGAGDPKKIPDIENMGAICKYVHDHTGYVPLVLRNPGQEYLQDLLLGVLTKSNVPVQKIGALSLEEVTSYMLRAKFVIVPDSGLFHIAVGLGVNILAFFTYTNPNLVRPEARNCRIVFRPEEIGEGGGDKLPHGFGMPSIEQIRSIVSSFLRDVVRTEVNSGSKP